MHDCQEQTDAKARHLVLVRSRAHDEVSQAKLQIRQTDQVWYHNDMDGSSLAHAIHASTSPLLWQKLKVRRQTEQIQKDPYDSKGYTHSEHQ